MLWDALPSALDLARFQFAFVVVWHFLFPAFTIGLASYLAVVQTLWLALRASGLGLGWVSILDPERLAADLGLSASCRPSPTPAAAWWKSPATATAPPSAPGSWPPSGA